MSRPFGRAALALALLPLFIILTASPGALPTSGAQRRTPAPPRRAPDARQAADGAQAAGIRRLRAASAVAPRGQGDSNCDGVEDSAPADFDDDAASDDGDNCPGVSNPGQWDWDGDGLGNECDPDDDGDQRDDAVDNCPGMPNPGQEDFERDGVGDVCDNSDAPGDGLYDAQDNCPLHANPDQKDTDGDHRGDACDADDDNDGRDDGADNCPLVPNPTQTDLDGDGEGFACDAGEQGRVYDSIKNARTVNAKGTFLTPVPVCPQCGEVIPNGHEEVIIVEAPAGFDVRVTDSEGRSVADGARGAGRHVLRFRPPPHGGSAARAGAFATRAGGAPSFGGGPAAARRLPLDRPAPDELRYYLVVTPPPRADPGRDYRVSFAFDRGVRAPSRRPAGRRPAPTPR